METATQGGEAGDTALTELMADLQPVEKLDRRLQGIADCATKQTPEHRSGVTPQTMNIVNLLQPGLITARKRYFRIAPPVDPNQLR